MSTYIYESYSDYLEFIKNHDFTCEKWIYDILDEKTETKNILYRDDDIIIVKSYGHEDNSKNNIKIHLLTIPTDKTIHSIRDLTGENIELLHKHSKKAPDFSPGMNLNYNGTL
jgi:m7GpppX diphosphatase